MYDIVKVFLDCETTGTNWNLHSIHQLSGLIEINGIVVEEFNIRLRPHPKALIERSALKVSHVTEEQIKQYPRYQEGKDKFVKIVSGYINKFDSKSRAYIVGFNNRAFDDHFLRKLFELCKDQFINSLFWPNSIDVYVLATEHLLHMRHDMPSFKLGRVAKTLGLSVDDSKLHDGLYDVRLTRAVYNIVKNS